MNEGAASLQCAAQLAAESARASAGRGTPKANLFIIRGFAASVKPAQPIPDSLTCALVNARTPLIAVVKTHPPISVKSPTHPNELLVIP